MRYLLQSQRLFPFQIHTYCLMTNHYHLLLETFQNSSLSAIMQHLGGRYALYFNRKYGHLGHAFQGRFGSLPVQVDAYFMIVCRYIHLNPVRAGMVQLPQDYAWSSYGAILRRERDPISNSQFLLGYFGNNEAEAVAEYQKFVEEDICREPPVTDRDLLRMRSWGALPTVGSSPEAAGR
jgi:putative transposase